MACSDRDRQTNNLCVCVSVINTFHDFQLFNLMQDYVKYGQDFWPSIAKGTKNRKQAYKRYTTRQFC